MASTTQNISVVVDGNGSVFAGAVSEKIRDYSNMVDIVDFTNNSPSTHHTRMMGGNDVVTLSDINLGGFSNKVNGNLGGDTFQSKLGSTTRDFILGGSENDKIDLLNSVSGGDWQNGNNGEDTIYGAQSVDRMSILRGGADDDVIGIKAGSKHIIVGDLGQDDIHITGATGRVVCRTDNGAAAQNIGESDRIFGFDADDKVFVPGVNSIDDLWASQIGGDTYLKADAFTNGTTGTRFIAKFENRTWADVNGYINSGQVVIGDTADNAYAALTPENFLNNPDLGGMFA
jgi:hypothetical protein